MASSGSFNFTITRDNLITDALLHIGAVAATETPSSAEITEMARLLNMLVKLRAADGMPLWAIKRGYVLPFTAASSINTTSHVVSAYERTTIGADEAAAQTTISVTSSSNMTTGDSIGIEQDDGTMHWTTVSSVTDGTTIIISDSLPTTSASGSQVFSYTASSDRVGRPLRIIEANILKVTDNTSWEITIEERNDYFKLGNRTTEGVPNRIYYDPTLGAATASPDSSSNWYGTIFVYPRFQDGEHIIEFTYQRPFQDFDSSTDNPDFPQEFYLPLMLELASLAGSKYGLPLDERNALRAEAKMYRDEALSTVYEEGSVFLQPEDENR